MTQTIIQVDAFTNTPFAGNPAAVCVLPSPQKENWMQNVAREMNLSETAFLVKQDDGFNLRWFTPAVEVPLCGHATLASAHVLWSEGHLSPNDVARFYTKSGLLIAKQQGDWIELDFPVNHSEETVSPPELSQALGASIKSVLKNSLGYLVEVESEELVRQMQPNFQQLKLLPPAKVIVTSLTHKDSNYDFISRFFAPGVGIDEDPVTGSAHCCLAPFWRDRLGKDEFLAYQASSRGGVVKVRYAGGDRVFLAGQAVTVMRGELIATEEEN
jgi:PhzF family phenazine biosynthesis protein